MDPISLLASSLDRNDEQPNIELARAIATNGDGEAVSKLINALTSKDRAVRSDAIKVLYELGAMRPELIVPYATTFVTLLSARDNRMIWGAMSALDSIANAAPEAIADVLPILSAAAVSGSVIANDRYTSILAKLNAQPDLRAVAFPLLLAQLQRAPTNQLPMYAELAAGAVSPDQIAALTTLLINRLEDVPQEAKRRRIAKALRILEMKSVVP